ncbi:MAG TPA: ribonuclease III domain-containing protein [Erysipelothrix sp.]
MQYSGNVLAFIGDAVLSLQVRQYLVEELGITKTKKLQETSINFVSANAQAAFMNYLLESEALTETEKLAFRRGRNASSKSSAKNADIITYRIATGLEALWGYLYLSEQTERLDELWKAYKKEVNL